VKTASYFWVAKSSAYAISSILVLTLACCSHFFEAGGSRTSLEADILFVSTDQNPMVDAEVYVVETVGTMNVVSEILKTDARGHIVLKGDYCLPAVVAVRGGNVVVQRETLARTYRVVVKGGDQPPLDRLAGKPQTRYLHYSRMHKSCG
jgi:hypothetical protein